MKMKLFSKLATKPRSRKVVRASAHAASGEEEYHESEPNMKLSHAFMVVLVLHVVAVAGIWAFNQLNSGKKAPEMISALAGKSAATAPSAQAVQAAPASAPAVAARQPGDADEPLPTVSSQSAAKPQSRAPVVTSVAGAAKPTFSTEVKPSAAKPAAQAAPAGATGAYTVAKGDNPYKIAKKLGVSYQALLDLNKIQDPTKLQIGTVLQVPVKKK